MSTIILGGLGLATTAFLARVGIRAMQKYRSIPGAANFYKGGFESKMNKREAVLILSLRYVFPPASW